jgi:GNAT superfamily N-acetyltransferase
MDTLRFETIDYSNASPCREAIAAFVHRAYGDQSRFKYPERWQWCYERPGARSFVAWAGDRVIGHVGAMPVSMRCAGAELTAHWSIDTFVLPEYRGRSIGKTLQQQASTSLPLFLSVWMSPINWQIKKSLGHVAVGTMRELEYRGPSPSRSPGAEPYRISAPAPDVVADHAARALEQYDLFAIRSHDYCAWRYVQQPWAGYFQVTTAYGIALARACGPNRPGMGMIADVFCTSAQAVTAQVECAYHALAERGCAGAKFASADPAIIAALAKRGWRTTARHPVLVSDPRHCGALRRVFLSCSDQDLDQYPW